MTTAINEFLKDAGNNIGVGLNCKDYPRPGMMGLAFWMGRHLSAEDLERLGAAEKLYGERTCNHWLCDILVKSGYYKWVPSSEDEVMLLPRCEGKTSQERIDEACEACK